MVDLIDRTRMDDVNKDVHTEHCCAQHGCKYADPDCPVASGNKPQSYPCESCEWEKEDEVRHNAEKDAEIERLRAELRLAWSAVASKAGWEWRKQAKQAEARAERMEEALRLIAAPMRPDGTWNRDREACRQIAEEALRVHDQEARK